MSSSNEKKTDTETKTEKKEADEKKEPEKTAESETKKAEAEKTDSSIFNKDNYLDKNTLMLTASFLAIYFIVFAILGIFYDGSDPTHHASKASFTDIIIMIIIIVIGVVYYYSLSPSEQENYWPDLLKSIKQYFNNAYSI